jgi:isocitrate dehydrogenase
MTECFILCGSLGARTPKIYGSNQNALWPTFHPLDIHITFSYKQNNSSKMVTYDFALMEEATEVKCSQFSDYLIQNL